MQPENLSTAFLLRHNAPTRFQAAFNTKMPTQNKTSANHRTRFLSPTTPNHFATPPRVFRLPICQAERVSLYSPLSPLQKDAS
jgi:hypothetical protein